MSIERGAHPKLSGLDGLRAVAVLLVFFYHNDVLGMGWVGVQIFFVLSGYLITRILYQSRNAPLAEYLRSFYGRRAVRIFPLYFTALGAIAMAGRAGLEMHGIREGLPYALTYTFNFYHASARFVHSKMITHFWSLCVEEQFYLVWPVIIYFAPQRTLRWLLPAIALSGPLVRGAEWWLLETLPAFFFERHDVALYVLTPSHLDAFATGATVSLFPPRNPRRGMSIALAALVVGSLVLQRFPRPPGSAPLSFGYPMGLAAGHAFLWAYTAMNFFAAYLVSSLARDEWGATFLDSRVLRYVGMISYGFYVMHYPLQSLVAKLLPHAVLAVKMTVQLAATVGLASASYYLLELRFLRLKDTLFPAPGPAALLRPATASPTE